MTTPSTPKLTIAIIGLGVIGPRHAQAVLQNPNTTLIAIVDPSPSASTLSANLKVPLYKSIATLLSSPHRPEAAIICTPNNTHIPIATTLISNNIHILIEKPFCTDPSEAPSLLTLLSHSPSKALVGHHRRFNPYITATLSLLPDLGSITAISGHWLLLKPPSYFLPPTQWHATSTGGVILINLIHEIDVLHYLFGPIARIHVEATPSLRSHAAEEGLAMTLRFRSGIVGTFLTCDATPSPWNFEMGTGENPSIPHVANESFMRIFGQKASLSVPDMTIWSYADGEKAWSSRLEKERVEVEERVPFDDQLEHFVRVCRGEEEPRCSVRAGLAAVVVCKAIKEGLEGSGTVDLEPYELE